MNNDYHYRSNKLTHNITTPNNDINMIYGLNKTHDVTCPVVDFDFIDDFKKEYSDNGLCNGYNYIDAINEKQDRVVAFGDIHGDYNLLIRLLKLSNVVKINDDGKLKWIGGKTYIVQVGDQIDSCRPIGTYTCDKPVGKDGKDNGDDIKILEVMTDLHNQAVKDGGAVISLLGNHEIMNSQGDMNHVSYENIRIFDNYKDPNDETKKFNNGKDARIHAFAPGNQYAKLMGCTRLPAVVIGANIFVHAGIIDSILDDIELRNLNDLEKINVKVKKWLLGKMDEKCVENIIKRSKNSMFWTRELGHINADTPLENPVCTKNISQLMNLIDKDKQIQEKNKIIQFGSIVIGHTPQSFRHNEQINSTCGGKIWRVDNGSSHAFDIFDKNDHYKENRKAQYLEILKDNEYVVHVED
jgi:hypothetical protein